MNRLVPVRTMDISSDGLLDHLFPVQIHVIVQNNLFYYRSTIKPKCKYLKVTVLS